MIVNYIFKNVILLIFILTINFQIDNSHNSYEINSKIIDNNDYKLSSYIENITNIKDIYLYIVNISYCYSSEFNLIETKYYFNLFDKNNKVIRPSDLLLNYRLIILCNIYIFDRKENIYSIPNIQENKYFFCIEYITIKEHIKFGIKAYKIDINNEEIEYFEDFFFTDKSINVNLDPIFQNNNKFNINYLNNNYNKLLYKINQYKTKKITSDENINLKTSFIQPPLCNLKRDIAHYEGRWYFNNIFDNYFCFCKGESCINIQTFNNYNYQSCKYFFYLKIIDDNRNLYRKTHYLLSDFYGKNIEPADAFPIFIEMLKKNLNAHYMTMSPDIYNKYCMNNRKCNKNLQIIYGVRMINGEILEKYLELFLKLKVVITADKFDSIDNLFYNIEYINYIFIGHGVTYIKSFLYNDYISHKKYNKLLLPPSDRFINLALDAGWEYDDIIKLGYPKWDKYRIHKNFFISLIKSKKEERSIFLMFTWRKVKKGKDISDLYYNNLYKILNNPKINGYLYKNNIKFFFCYHHEAKAKVNISENNNLVFINQNDISKLLQNSSLIITDFSSILFEAIVQKKPLILYIPDGLDKNIKNLYDRDYYETITKIKKGIIYLYEVFFDLKKVIKKIIYYIKNDFVLEDKKLDFYKEFKLENSGNTKKFISYVKKLN